jgi:hypothetical protein
MANTILRFVNQGGIPCIEDTGVTLTTAAATFSFNRHSFVRGNFSGLILVKITSTFTAPTTAVDIQFVTAGVANSTQTVYESNTMTAVTTATWPGPGIYLAMYDRESDKLVLLTGIA